MSRGRIDEIALQRIERLFCLAEEVYRENPALAQRYVSLARRIAMRARLSLPREFRRRVCRGCGAFLVPGSSSRVRVRQRREPHVSITCLRCGRVYRIPLGRR
ncbi:MAG: ribonuclease P [Candidatus Bathyarchaeia archaeon]|nr:ribonuclease P [Candidatus Bathyarchaeota archaeon]